MRKQQYVAAVACLVAGVIGFVGVYATDKGRERKEAQQQIAAETQQEAPTSYEVKPQTSVEDATKKAKEQADKIAKQKEQEQKEAAEKEKAQKEQETKKQEETVQTAAPALHFDKNSAVWPIEGDVLLDYSMDSTIYFPTLEQYRCNPAMVIGGAVNDKVVAMAKGTITDVRENEETGCTVVEDLGDGYTAIYGQLKELNAQKGDTIEAGQVLGYVSEPTKYYSTEGSNVYFQLQKNGKAVDPKEYLPEMSMDTLD